MCIRDRILVYISIAGVAEELCMKLPGHTSNLHYGDIIHVRLPRENYLLFDSAGVAFTRNI